jgi:PAS domain-containing protein
MRELTDTLPVAVYTTDVAGRITHFNEAAASLWGRRPVLGEDRWCGSWQLFWADGTPLPHDRCPMAMALKEDRPVRGLEGEHGKVWEMIRLRWEQRSRCCWRPWPDTRR